MPPRKPEPVNIWEKSTQPNVTKKLKNKTVVNQNTVSTPHPNLKVRLLRANKNVDHCSLLFYKENVRP